MKYLKKSSLANNPKHREIFTFTFNLLVFTFLGLPGISTGRRVPADEDLEDGNVRAPRGGRNIVISRPTTAYNTKGGDVDLPPPPYQETTLVVGGGGGTAVPLGSYGGGGSA